MLRNEALNCLGILLLTALLVVGVRVVPSAAAVDCNTCIPCHGNVQNYHGTFSHVAAPGSGVVALFEDFTHESAGWTGSPHFGVQVDCTLCHNVDLPLVHGNECATCHPTPYDTLGSWQGGCQQGGCHSDFHQNAATTAHLPFENADDPSNDCSRCHFPNGIVTQAKCQNCHALYLPGDVSPPVTVSNAKATYYGQAKIDFTVMENGKIGVGRTFYRLNGGTATAAGKSLVVSTPGPHQLEFWSKDQSGNTETATNTVVFNIIVDNTAPTTTSNAISGGTYYQGTTITLTATDDGPDGAKATYYRLNGGTTQTGTSVVIPATFGTIAYTLTFWSEDYAGNVESPKSVAFTVISGTGTLRLVWGSSDTAGSPCGGDPEANIVWEVRRGGSSGPLLAPPAAAGCPNWSGVVDVAVPVSPTPYHVKVIWWNSDEQADEETIFPNVSVTTPGQVVRLGY